MKIEKKGSIHQSVLTFGSGHINVAPGSEIRAYTVLEMVNGNFSLGPNSVIGYNSFIQCSGKIEIGSGSLLGPHCCFIASSHPIDSRPLVLAPLIRGNIKIGNNVWIGANVTINTNVTIGDNVVIGANSFVNKDIPNNEIWAGTPIRKIRNRS